MIELCVAVKADWRKMKFVNIATRSKFVQNKSCVSNYIIHK